MEERGGPVRPVPVSIIDGLYGQGGSGLEFQLYYRDLTPFQETYLGPAHVNMAERLVTIERSSTDLLVLVMAMYPTKESAERSAGRDHALRQKIRRHPGPSKSSAYYWGWHMAWEERRSTPDGDAQGRPGRPFEGR